MLETSSGGVRLSKLLEEQIVHNGACSMNASIYDTAWVSMIQKNVGGIPAWFSPSSFNCICDLQCQSGGWEGGDMIDEIMNSLSCLLALKRHQNIDLDRTPELAEKVRKANEFISQRLLDWENEEPERVGYELLLPSLLDQLELEGVYFKFPMRGKLNLIRKEKLAKLNLEHVYRHPSTLLHSLEALIGVIDFNRLSHHLRDGSMMGSPASTAAYLIHSTSWNKEAERYLSNALLNGARIRDGVVTNVFPIRTFELAWVRILI